MDAPPPGKPDGRRVWWPYGTLEDSTDASALLRLVSDYRIAVQGESELLRARLLPGLDATDPQVARALAAWGGKAHVQDDEWGTEVLLVRPVGGSGTSRWLLHGGLFLLTLFTTMGAGALMQGVDPLGTRFVVGGWLALPSGVDSAALWRGATFALPFLAILLGHESGHYFAARHHRIAVTPPFFIPMPPWISMVGTLGAFIRIKGPTVRRSVLFDVGVAGPFVSFVLSLPVLVAGLAMSRSVAGVAHPATPFLVRFVGEPVWLGNAPLLQLFGMWFFPELGSDPVLLHPLAFAGWLGLFVTALNLMPLGQLDGGHILYSLWEQPGQERAARLFLVALLPLGALWWGWWVWGVAALLVNRGRLRHPPVLQSRVALDPRRRWLARVAILIFFLTLPPVPLAL